MKRLTITTAFLAALLLGLLIAVPNNGFAQYEEIKPPQFRNSFVRETPTDITAAYVVIYNFNDFPDYLQGASSPWAERVELHTTDTGAKGIRSMHQIKRVGVPNNGHLTLRPGSLHLMVYGVNKSKLRKGQIMPITLNFARMGRHIAYFPVRAITYMQKSTSTPAQPTDQTTEKTEEKKEPSLDAHQHH